MPTTTNIPQLKINYLTEAQYQNAIQQGNINEDELYFTESSGVGSTIKTWGNATYDANAIMVPVIASNGVNTEYIDIYDAYSGGRSIDVTQPLLYSTKVQSGRIELVSSVDTVNISDIGLNFSSSVQLGEDVYLPCVFFSATSTFSAGPIRGYSEIPTYSPGNGVVFYYLGRAANVSSGAQEIQISSTGRWCYYHSTLQQLVPFSFVPDWALLSQNTINQWNNLLNLS